MGKLRLTMLLAAVPLAACPTANPPFLNDAATLQPDASTTNPDATPGNADAAEPGDGTALLDGSTTDGGAGDTGSGGLLRERSCQTVVSYRPGAGTDIFIAGSWDGFSATAHRMTDPDGDGSYTASLDLVPGLYGYKFVVDGQWKLDPSHAYRAYFDHVENSGLRVPDCREPFLELKLREGQLNGAGRGTAAFVLRYTEANGGSGPDNQGILATLSSATGTRTLTAGELSFDGATWELRVSLSGLTDGKHTVAVRMKNKSGKSSNKVLLPFWVEADAFDWRDAVIYMVMTDRFRDGNAGNNPDPTPNATSSADFKGGDLQGVAQAIRDGYFDDLQVKALWLTPFNVNPTLAQDEGDGRHFVTGYHGYWPIDPRHVDPRIGGDAALLELTRVAHEHGIRVLMDFVINHVHEQHPYVTQHPDWFFRLPNGCICGTENCDWTTHRLDCLFKPYMPDINWENNAASETFIADALHWLEAFDLDGLRVDAVKHVPDGAIFNLSTQIEERLEIAGTNYFTVGETAMGWGDCNADDPQCNANDYGTISRYIGPHALDGQFDFVLHHSSALSVFAYQSRGLLHADVWTRASQRRYPAGAIMTPYVGSHDEARFVSHVTNSNVIGNKWPDQQLPPPPQDDVPYQRLALAETWNLTIPGAPLLYYGDEYGEFGSSDPDNRHMMRFGPALNAREQALFQKVRAVTRARWELPALRRGGLETLSVSESFWAYARSAGANYAIVAMNRSGTGASPTLTVPGSITLPAGTVLHDRLGGPSVTVTTAGQVPVSLGPYSAAILAP